MIGGVGERRHRGGAILKGRSINRPLDSLWAGNHSEGERQKVAQSPQRAALRASRTLGSCGGGQPRTGRPAGQ